MIVRFAGDSGDGMQLTGDRFTSETALLGNDLATFPDFPAEIRAPAGSLPGVSGFQVHFADHDILTPGDRPDVLVAMNPAALKANIDDMPKGATLIVNTDAFNDRNLQKAGYEASPIEDGSLDHFHVHEVALTSMTVEALKGVEGITSREAERSKNFFALGLMSWLYHRPTDGTLTFIGQKFAKRPEIAEANTRAFKAGWNYGETSEDFAVSYEVAPAKLAPGTYRQITGNGALAYGLIAASRLSGLPLFLGAYPITPASGILEELARFKHFGVTTFQAEDEIAACGAALGAAFGGCARRDHLGGARRRAQGRDRRARRGARAAAADPRHPARRPVDRHADQARAGRPADGALRPQLGEPRARDRRRLAVRLLRRRARGRADRAHLPHPRLPALRRVPRERLGALADPGRRLAAPIDVDFATAPNDGERFLPYLRDPETLARPWAIPGTPGLEHRIGGLEKADGTGNVSYDPENHDLMTRLRAQKVAGIAADIPELEVDDPTGAARTLVLGWGSTYGPIGAAVRRVRTDGHEVAQAHLRYLNPFPRNTGEVLRRYEKILVPEMNLGQLLKLIRAEFLVDAVGYNKVRGRPFRSSELAEAIEAVIES